MNEQFLSFVWKYRLYNKNLVTTTGVPVTVIRPGEQHSNAGPDFFNARVRIGETLWAGNIEIHVSASDWYRHGHQHDKAYRNVILHVVYEADSDIIISDLTTVPTVSLYDQTNPEILKKYAGLRASQHYIPCGNNLRVPDKLVLNNWLDRMLVERLEHKSLLIEQTLIATAQNWEETFYQLLARNFGFHVNAGPFEMLARSLPRRILMKHSDNPLQYEALVFGQAGFLQESFTDEYPSSLAKEFRFLAQKYKLTALDKHIWKLLRMRPANFPSIRLSQWANLIAGSRLSFSCFLGKDAVSVMVQKLQIQASHYWCNHFLFDMPTAFNSRFLGEGSAWNLVTNTIAPMLFYYGKSRHEQQFCESAFNMLREAPPDINRITAEWKKYGVQADNAYISQALLNLYNQYCDYKKCLNCSLGTSILRDHV